MFSENSRFLAKLESLRATDDVGDDDTSAITGLVSNKAKSDFMALHVSGRGRTASVFSGMSVVSQSRAKVRNAAGRPNFMDRSDNKAAAYLRQRKESMNKGLAMDIKYGRFGSVED